MLRQIGLAEVEQALLEVRQHLNWARTRRLLAVMAGLWIGYFTGSLLSAIAILAALHARRRTGEGQMIDLAQAEVLIRALDWTWMYCDRAGKDRPQSRPFESEKSECRRVRFDREPKLSP